MAFKALVLCAFAVVIQEITAQPVDLIDDGALLGSGLNLGLSSNLGLANSNLVLGVANSNVLLNNNGLANRRTASNANANLSSGGGFQVTSSSPIAPTGVSVLAENLAIQGPLTVDGNLPVLASVGLDGQLATSGQASTQYSCGNGNVGISSQLGAGTSGAAVASSVGINGAGISSGASTIGAGIGGIGIGGSFGNRVC